MTLDRNLTYPIFHFFNRVIIRVVYTIFVIIIKDLKIHLINENLLLRKNAFWFEPLAQKRKIS